jgi:tetratricopeptide (TPR) repeat protein
MKYLIFSLLVLSISICKSQNETELTLARLQYQGKLNLVPMYGDNLVNKTHEYTQADNEFIAFYDNKYSNRKIASEELILWGLDFFYNGQLQTAMKRFNQAWLIDTVNPGIYFGYWLVQSVLTQGNLKDEFYGLKGAELDKLNDLNSFFKKGKSLDENNKYEKYALTYGCSSFSSYGISKEGIKACEALLGFDQYDTLTLRNLASTYSDMENWEKAIFFYSKNLDYSKNKSLVYNDIAWNYQKKEVPDSASKYYIMAIESSASSYYKPRVNYALLTIDINKCENGIKYLEEVINEQPNEGFLYFIKGKLFLCLNKDEEAKNMLKKGKKLGNAESKDLLKTL